MKAYVAQAEEVAAEGGAGPGAAGKPRKVFPAFEPRTTAMLPPNTFQGQVALVTGGGTGLGFGMAEMLSELGATVAICSRKQDVLDEAAEAIMAKTRGKVLPLAMDVRDPDAIADVFGKIEAEVGLPDVVINNACVLPRARPRPRWGSGEAVAFSRVARRASPATRRAAPATSSRPPSASRPTAGAPSLTLSSTAPPT